MKTTRSTVMLAVQWCRTYSSDWLASRQPAQGDGLLPGTGFALATAALILTVSASLHAQGVLTVTPSRTITTTAGTGALGYAGNGGAPTSATLADPSGLAYDQAGNLYVAEARNHVVREILSTGTITLIAGTGIQGYGGDGATATAAELDTPAGVAVDARGDIYIADSHNHRIREISGGIIRTIAGTGIPGSSGDGAAAAAAQLALPSGVAVDADGNVYIADTNNHRIRKITAGTISTIAGNGEQLFSGDGGAATSAALDSPTGVAVDLGGNVYIADRHNQRIRLVDSRGTISTLAGGASGLFGGFGGDGATAVGSALARPSGVSVDTAGNVWIADTGNQRIRQFNGGAIATVAGTGSQGFAGDGGPATAAMLNVPRAAIAGTSGALIIADTLNQRVRSSTLPTLALTSSAASIASAPQGIILANTGNAALTIQSLGFSGSFATSPGGTCFAVPFQLGAGASCAQDIAYLPSTAGTAKGSVTVSGPGIVPQTILLTGTVATALATVALTASSATVFAGQPVTFSVVVSTPNAVPAAGTVTFYNGSAQIGSVQTLANNGAAITTTSLPPGTYNITATYSGDANFVGSTSAAIKELVANADFTIVPNPSSPFRSSTQTVLPGHPAHYGLMIQPMSGPLSYPVVLSATGLPPGATVSFNPQTVNGGASAVNFTMTIQTAAAKAALLHASRLAGAAAMGLLLLPFVGSRRCRTRYWCAIGSIAIAIASGSALSLISGCGSRNGFFVTPETTYTIQVIGTTNGPGGATLHHRTAVLLRVE
jgi:sugar lactone lactonase YvrE